MKKILIMMLLFAIMIPTFVNATTYYLGGTDMNISINDSEWYIFTRDNLKNNLELDTLGITSDYLYNFMHTNSVYLDAILYFNNSDDYIELFVRKKEFDNINNLSNYSINDILELSKELATNQNASNYAVHESNYKYIFLEYFDSGYYINEYSTIVNGNQYTITAQKPYEFSYSDKVEIEKIINSIVFKVDKTNDSSINNIIDDSISSLIISLFIAIIGIIFGKIKAKRKFKTL